VRGSGTLAFVQKHASPESTLVFAPSDRRSSVRTDTERYLIGADESDGFAWPQHDGLKWPHLALVDVLVG